MRDDLCWLDTEGRGVTGSGDAISGGLYDAGLKGCKVAFACPDMPDASYLLRCLCVIGWEDRGSRTDSDRVQLRLRHRETGRCITVTNASGWLGHGDYSYHTARRAMMALDAALWREFQVGLSITPGLTGIDAWQKHAGEWPVYPQEVRDILMSMGQGRFEACPAPCLTELPGLVLLDARMGYLAAAKGLEASRELRHEERPIGGWRDDQPWVQDCRIIGGFEGYTTGFYKVRFRAPEGWAHVGLLPMRIGPAWHWPLAATFPMECWATADEVRLAVERRWQIEVLERLLYVKEDAYKKPFSSWAGRLERMYQEPGKLGFDEFLNNDMDLARKAIRNIANQTIGMFARGQRKVTRQLADGELHPDTRLAQDTYRRHGDGTAEYEDYDEDRGRFARLRHPEFAAGVWGRQRVSLLSRTMITGGERVQVGALHLPREDTIGFQLDGIFAARDPGWPDDGGIGRFRVKATLPGPLPVPTSYNELAAMMKEQGQ